MRSSVLNSKTAIQVNIAIVRAFVLLRQHLADYRELKEQIQRIEGEMDMKFEKITHALNHLLKKDHDQKKQQSRRKIGYK
ncbi:MAG: hypothetical protein AAFX53_10020 [Bacteroidota bacterium]